MAVELVEIPVENLAIGDDIRLDDDSEELAGLAASIKRLGVLQPLLVRKVGGMLEVVAGRRRLAASRLVGLATVPCIIRDFTVDDMFDATVAENGHRRNLSAVEEALGYSRMYRDGLSQQAIADRVGRSQKHISTLLQVLELPHSVRDDIHRGRLGYTTALARREKTGKRQGGSGGPPRGKKDEGEVASHWRRRHDRLLAGLQVLLRAHPSGVHELKTMIEKVLKLDAQPLEPKTDKREKDWRAFGK